MSDYLDPANEELLKDFFEEARQQVELLEQNIIILENDPDNHDSIDEIFRAAHTLKGGAATVEMAELAEFTHHIEDILDAIRSNSLKASQEVVDILLESIDITRAMVEERAAGGIYQEDITNIVKSLTSFLLADEDRERTEPKTKPVEKKAAQFPEAGQLSEYEMLELQISAGENNPIYHVRVSFNEDNPMNTVGGIQVFAILNKAGKVLRTEPDFDQLYSDHFFPVVDFYLTTEKSEDQLKRLTNITDVILKTEIYRIDEMETATPAVKAVEAEKQELKAEAPAPEAFGDETEELEKSQEAISSDAEKKDLAQERFKLQARKKEAVYGSVLRVDSRRIDDLLNIVSETVIIKATFNQLSSRFAGSLLRLQAAEENYRKQIKDFLDALPEYLEKFRNGDSLNTIKRTLQARMDRIYEDFDSCEGTLRSNVLKFRNISQNLGRVTSELQEGVMKIRMVPISHIFARFPRLVRDLTRSLKKDINLATEGEDTELDKSVIEDILDPLIHCVRNSVDHGIEPPEQRLKAGKNAQGEIRLTAHNEGNMIIITVFDDGRGIDVESIRKKAIDRGLIHPSKTLSDVEAFNLIFEPGFSTAKKITKISGRGVGLDVVRKQVEKLNGSVSVQSELGKGTTIIIRLPMTLAIIQGLLVRVDKEIYAIPINCVVESLRLRPPEIKMIDHQEVFNLREDVLSLLRLDRLFKIKTDEDKPYRFVVVVGSGEKKVGLMVDSLIGEEDVVIKPLRDRYTNSPGITGATILGDGTVSLILDVSQLLEFGLKSEMDARIKRETAIQ